MHSKIVTRKCKKIESIKLGKLVVKIFYAFLFQFLNPTEFLDYTVFKHGYLYSKCCSYSLYSQILIFNCRYCRNKYSTYDLSCHKIPCAITWKISLLLFKGARNESKSE